MALLTANSSGVDRPSPQISSTPIRKPYSFRSYPYHPHDLHTIVTQAKECTMIITAPILKTSNPPKRQPSANYLLPQRQWRSLKRPEFGLEIRRPTDHVRKRRSSSENDIRVSRSFHAYSRASTGLLFLYYLWVLYPWIPLRHFIMLPTILHCTC